MPTAKFGPDQAAFAESVGRTVDRERGADDGAAPPDDRFDRALWRRLGELGVWSLAAHAGPDGPATVAAACHELGGRLVAGPVAETFHAGLALDGPDAAAVQGGELVGTVGSPRFLPWALRADRVIVRDRGGARLLAPGAALRHRPDVRPGEWAAAEPGAHGTPLPDRAAPERAATVARDAYLLGVARRMLDATVAHARAREQFGHPIGDFQAVAHRLADAALAVESAESALAGAVRDVAVDDVDDLQLDHATLGAAGAARTAVASAHQVFGAIGYTLEGPLAASTVTVQQILSISVDRDAAVARIASALALGGHDE